MKPSLQNHEKRLKQIEARNRRVETDKTWESSWTRRTLLTFFTYLSVALYLKAININRPWLNALVPALGFMLSTLTLPSIKKLWLRHKHKHNKHKKRRPAQLPTSRLHLK